MKNYSITTLKSLGNAEKYIEVTADALTISVADGADRVKMHVTMLKVYYVSSKKVR